MSNSDEEGPFPATIGASSYLNTNHDNFEDELIGPQESIAQLEELERMFESAGSPSSAASKPSREFEKSRGSFISSNKWTLVLIIALLAIMAALGIFIPSLANKNETNDSKTVDDGNIFIRDRIISSWSPSLSPTHSIQPSASLSFVPTEPRPTTSPRPSGSPSMSSNPSSLPTALPTDSISPTVSSAPSGMPTVSLSPTMSISPSALPTLSVSPTESLLPTRTMVPSPPHSPSPSEAPTASAVPTNFPISPTMSIYPSALPTLSVSPTESLLPTRTMVPSSPPSPSPSEAPTASAAPTNFPTETPNITDPCFTSTSALIIAQGVDERGDDQRKVYTICDNTVIDVGFPDPTASDPFSNFIDGDYPLGVIRPNVTVQCVGCVLNGGFLQMVTVPVYEIPPLPPFDKGTDGMIIDGITFSGSLPGFAGTFLSNAMLLTSPGKDIVIQNCIFKDLFINGPTISIGPSDTPLLGAIGTPSGSIEVAFLKNVFINITAYCDCGSNFGITECISQVCGYEKLSFEAIQGSTSAAIRCERGAQCSASQICVADINVTSAVFRIDDNETVLETMDIYKGENVVGSECPDAGLAVNLIRDDGEFECQDPFDAVVCTFDS